MWPPAPAWTCSGEAAEGMFNARCGLGQFTGDRCDPINWWLGAFLDAEPVKSRNLMDTMILITMERDC